jgi:hypothetical protein
MPLRANVPQPRFRIACVMPTAIRRTTSRPASIGTAQQTINGVVASQHFSNGFRNRHRDRRTGRSIGRVAHSVAYPWLSSEIGRSPGPTRG